MPSPVDKHAFLNESEKPIFILELIFIRVGRNASKERQRDEFPDWFNSNSTFTGLILPKTSRRVVEHVESVIEIHRQEAPRTSSTWEL